jgi:chaperonin cofactor prefoldin
VLSVKPLAALGFKREEEPEAVEHERVVELFRNRAELKKAYASLQEEIERLKDRVKQQEGATARVQEMLEALEQRLGSSETAFPALVFYHLRGLWSLGRELIAQLVADLSRQQEEKERRQHLAECNRRQFARRQALESELREAETAAADAVAQFTAAKQQLAGLTRFWHYFRRRELAHRIVGLEAACTVAGVTLDESRAKHEALAAEQEAEFPGLSVPARRAINLAAIGYAEALCLRLARTPLVALGRDAAGRREVMDDYGDRARCESLMRDIDRARAILQQRNNLPLELRERSDRLRELAKYRNPADTVPTAESVGFSEGDVLNHEAQGAAAARLPNVLAEDTWDLFRILLR